MKAKIKPFDRVVKFSRRILFPSSIIDELKNGGIALDHTEQSN
jgi:hypothetical protein